MADIDNTTHINTFPEPIRLPVAEDRLSADVSAINSPVLAEIVSPEQPQGMPEVEGVTDRERRINRLKAAFVAVCLGPGNEIGRYGLFGVSESLGAHPTVSAAVFAASTAGIEGVSAKFGAELLSRPGGKKVADAINKGAEKIGMSRGVKLSKPLKVSAAMLGGSFVSEIVEKVEDPAIEEEDLKKKGYLWTKLMVGTMALQGYGMAKGVDSLSLPYLVAGGGAVFATLASVLGVMKKTIQRREVEQDAPELVPLVAPDSQNPEG